MVTSASSITSASIGVQSRRYSIQLAATAPCRVIFPPHRIPSDLLQSSMSHNMRLAPVLQQLRPALDRREHGRAGRHPQTTQRGVGHGEADILEDLQIVGSPLTAHDSLQYFELTLCAELARIALATRLVGEEMGQAEECPTHIPLLVDRHNDARAE